MYKGHKICFIGKLKGLAEESKRLRQRMLKHKAEKGYSTLQGARTFLKSEIRHYALAYAFIRKIPYSLLERSCNERPNAATIFKIVQHHSFFMIHLEKKKIEKWLNGESK